MKRSIIALLACIIFAIGGCASDGAATDSLIAQGPPDGIDPYLTDAFTLIQETRKAQEQTGNWTVEFSTGDMAADRFATRADLANATQRRVFKDHYAQHESSGVDEKYSTLHMRLLDAHKATLYGTDSLSIAASANSTSQFRSALQDMIEATTALNQAASEFQRVSR